MNHVIELDVKKNLNYRDKNRIKKYIDNVLKLHIWQNKNIFTTWDKRVKEDVKCLKDTLLSWFYVLCKGCIYSTLVSMYFTNKSTNNQKALY